MNRRDFIRITGLGSAIVSFSPVSLVRRSTALSSMERSALSTLLNWKQSGTNLDAIAIDAIGFSGSPPALKWLDGMEANMESYRDKKTRNRLYWRIRKVIISARARLDPEWFNNQVLAETNTGWDLPVFKPRFPLSRQARARLWEIAREKDEWQATSALIKCDREFREKILAEIQGKKRWDKAEMCFHCEEFNEFPPDEALPALVPIFGQLEGDYLQPCVLQAFFSWPAGLWDKHFPNLVSLASRPEKAITYFPYHSFISTPAGRERMIWMLSQFVEHSRTGTGALMAAEKILCIFGGEVPGMADKMKTRWTQACNDVQEEDIDQGEAAGRVTRWLAAQGEFVDPDALLAFGSKCVPDDIHEILFTLGYLSHGRRLNSQLSWLISRVGPSLLQKYDNATYSPLPMKDLSYAVQDMKILRRLEFEKITLMGIHALAWNQAIGIRPNLGDWISYVSRKDALMTAEEIFSRFMLYPRQTSEAFRHWVRSPLYPEQLWGYVFSEDSGGLSRLKHLFDGIRSGLMDLCREAAFISLVKSGAEGRALAARLFMDKPCVEMASPIYGFSSKMKEEGLAVRMLKHPSNIVSLVGASCIMKQKGMECMENA